MGIHIMPPLYKMVIVPPAPPGPPPFQTIFYPDAHPEVTSVDGGTFFDGPNLSWPACRAADGTTSQDSSIATTILMRCSTAGPPNNYYQLYRGLMLFDMSVNIGCHISSATLYLMGYLKAKNDPINPALGVYSSWPLSNIALVPSDHQRIGDTPLSAPLAYDDFTINVYNPMPLNAAGIAFLNAALAGDGIVKLGIREHNFDAPNIEPWPGLSGRYAYFYYRTAENSLARKPYLEVA